MQDRQPIEQHDCEQENTADEMVLHLNPKPVEETKSNPLETKNLKAGSRQVPQGVNHNSDELEFIRNGSIVINKATLVP